MAQLTHRIPAAQELQAELPVAVRGLTLGRLALPALVVLAAVLDLFDLTISGWANTYYAIAAQAASQSWTALFFGSLDASNFVTLDKPPLAILPMAISVRLLGLSSFSILLPEALLGVGTVVVLFLAVRRSFGMPAAFVAGLVAALTPVAVLIFRYDNPDALLTFVLVSAAWALGRGLEAGRIRWALLAAALVGLAFLTKYLQAYLVLPAFGVAWLVCAPGSLRRRVGGLLASAVTVLVASGWWVAIVELIPARSRPYVGGSTTNSVLELIFGYDGLGRIFGNAPPGQAGAGLGSVVPGLASGGGPFGGGAFGGPAGGGAFSGTPGFLRLLNDQLAGQIGWLLPLAGLAFVVGTAGLWHVARVRRTDRRLAGYLVWGGWLVTHALVFSLMSGIIHSYYTVVLAPAIGALVGAAAWQLWTARDSSRVARLLLPAGIVLTGVVAFVVLDRTPGFAAGLGFGVVAISLAAALVLAIPPLELDRRLARAAAIAGLVAILAGPAAYSAATIAQAHAGGDPAAGPGGDGTAGQVGSIGDTALAQYLAANRGSARWIVAVNGSQTAASIQLATGEPVMSMGGFSGGDPTPALAQLQDYIGNGELRYVYLGGGGPAGLGGPGFGRFGGSPRGLGAGPNGLGGGGAAGSAGVPAGAGNQASIGAWVTTSCSAVSVTDSASSGLYDCAGA